MYVDDNGIVRFENLDDITPLQTNLNTALESVSSRVTAMQEELDQLDPDQIVYEDLYLRIGDDGTPRLWTDPKALREYTNAAPAEERNRVMVATQFGTFGTLMGALDRNYIPYRIAAGSVNITNSSSTTGSATVTFPAGRFTSTPRVVTDPGTTSPSIRQSSAYNISSTSATVYLWTSNATTVAVDWIAIQP